MAMQSVQHRRTSIQRYSTRLPGLLDSDDAESGGHGGHDQGAHGSSAPAPQRPDAKRYYALVFSWILLVMGGFVAIICVGTDRFHEHPFGSEW